MSEDIKPFQNVVRENQQSWHRSMRRNPSKFQSLFTYVLPESLSASFHQTITGALPVSQTTKENLLNTHPTPIIISSFGSNRLYTATLNKRFPHVTHTEEDPRVASGAFWIEEQIVGEATLDAIRTIKNRRLGLLSTFTNPREAISGAHIRHKNAQEFLHLFENKKTRSAIFQTWFDGDKDGADSLLRRHISMSTNDFAASIGSKQRNHSKNEPPGSESGRYLPGTGIIYVRSTDSWIISMLTLGGLMIGHENGFDMYAQLLTLLGGSALAFHDSATYQATTIVHEDVHYNTDGATAGWYKQPIVTR